MTSSMLAPANADPAGCQQQSSGGSSSASFPTEPSSLLVGSGSLAGKATTASKECSGSTTTDTGGLVSTSSHHHDVYTVHHQPPLRSHVNLLHHNSELSITANSTLDPMQQAAATDYFRPYLHTNPYPPAAAAGGVAAAAGHHMTHMAPHPASMHSHYAASPFNVHHPGSRIGDQAAAMAAAAAVSAAAAAVAQANNNTPAYKGYQDLYSNNNPSLELSSTTHVNDAQASTASSTSSSSLSDQQYNNNGGQRLFPARPQPTRPVMVGGSPKPPKDSTNMQPPPLSPLHNSNNNNSVSSLTPPPSVVAHHRSQQSSQQKSSGNSNLASSAALYRDKLGLNSPSGPNSTTPPTTLPPVSPADANTNNNNSASVRRLSGNSGASSSNNPKFRYPSGPSSSSSPPPPATPSSAMSSREGTPLPPSQRPEDAAPNVDISRVQIAESDSVIKREEGHLMGIKREQSDQSQMPGFKRESGETGSSQQMAMGQQQQAPVATQASQQQHQYGYSPATSTSPSTFSAQYPYLAQHQQQHHTHMGWQPQHYYSSPLDGTNNNLMVRSLQDGLRSTPSSMTGAMGGYGSASSYADHSQYQYGTTIHHYGDPTATAQHSVMASSNVVSRTAGSAGTGLGRGRGHHHSGSGNGVKIGRRPAHLPKVLKFQDKSLPPGWVRKLKCRKHGKQAGRWDVYIYSPCGVKFASKKKLKAFFEKNQLTYDIEEFDFTPYGRHTDSGATGRGPGSSAGSSNSAASNSSSAAGTGTSNSSAGGAGRHNSSGSTGSEGTHTGGSPASLHNYSPTHHHALHSSISTTPTSSSTYMPQSMMTPGTTSSLYGTPMSAAAAAAVAASSSAAAAAADFSTFSAFDPLMENPPNVSVQDVPTSMSASSAAAAAVAAAASDFTASSLVAATGFGVKTDSSSDYFPAEMAEILGSSPSVTSSLSNGLTGSAFGPPHGLSAGSTSSDPYSDLSRSLHHAGSLHPLSNASMESRGSTEEEGDEALSSQRGDNKVSGLSKAFRALNDFGSVYSFE